MHHGDHFGRFRVGLHGQPGGCDRSPSRSSGTRLRPASWTAGWCSAPMVLVLVLFTWLIGGIFAIGEAREDGGKRLPTPPGGVVVRRRCGCGIRGLRAGPGCSSQPGRVGCAWRSVSRTVGHIVVFDACSFCCLGLGLAAGRCAGPGAALAGPACPASLSSRWQQRSSWRAFALVLITTVNIRTVQADTYFKQGTGYEGVGQWEGSVLLYREAAACQPQEDYYYLFLGRALLQLSDQMQPGNRGPAGRCVQRAHRPLLGMVDAGHPGAATARISCGPRHAVLVGAQRLNPYNTDHSANLARLFRAWAFTGAVDAGRKRRPRDLAGQCSPAARTR